METKTKQSDSKIITNGFNLLNIKALRSLILSKGFPYVFQIVMLSVFLTFIVIGWQVYAPENINDKLFAKTNIVTLCIWGIWWPLMIWFAVAMGRIWCMVCPLEFVSNIFERFGRYFGINQKQLPKWISGGAIIVFLYVLIQLLVAGVHLHRIPAYTSFFLIGLLFISAFVGISFKDRAFCRGFCPIGMLLNAYGRGGIISVRAGSEKSCINCTSKDCIITCNKTNLDARSCPSLLNPPKLNSNKDCLICAQCIKSCGSNNMQLLLRKPFEITNDREEKASWVLTIFIVLVSGFVTYELTTEWNFAKEIFLTVPNYFTHLFGLQHLAGLVKGVWTLGVFPFLFWSILALLARLSGSKNDLFEIWRELALPTVIIISAGHLIKAVAKLNTWAGYLPESLSDLFAKKSFMISPHELSIQASFVSASVISVIGVVLLIISLIYSLREERIIYNRILNSHLLPKLFLFIFFLTLVIGIGMK